MKERQKKRSSRGTFYDITNSDIIFKYWDFILYFTSWKKYEKFARKFMEEDEKNIWNLLKVYEKIQKPQQYVQYHGKKYGNIGDLRRIIVEIEG